MDPLLVGGLSIAAMLAMIALGVPVGLGIALVAIVGLYHIGGMPLMMTTLEGLPYEFASQYGFVVIPMFILMGALAENARITEDFYTFFYRLLGRLRGGLLMVTILSSAGFAAISGSTMVNAVVFTRIALPQMIRFGYDRAISAGCIAAAGTFAALIPPSIMMVIYALLTGESIGALLIAGILPGLLTALAYLVGVAIMVRINPDIAPVPEIRFTAREKLSSFLSIGPFVVLAVIVIGGIYSGVMFPSSAGAVGAAGAFVLLVVRRLLAGGDFGWPAIGRAFRESAATTAVLFLVIIAGLLLSRVFVYSGFVSEIVSAIEESGLTRWGVLVVIVLMYLVLGCFMDTVSMTVVTVPFVYPIIVSLGFDPIWFGVILIKLIEMSVLTPPVGLNLFAVLSAAEGQITSAQVFRGVLPFFLIECVVLVVLILVPEISLFLPEMMSG